MQNERVPRLCHALNARFCRPFGDRGYRGRQPFSKRRRSGRRSGNLFAPVLCGRAGLRSFELLAAARTWVVFERLDDLKNPKNLLLGELQAVDFL